MWEEESFIFYWWDVIRIVILESYFAILSVGEDLYFVLYRYIFCRNFRICVLGDRYLS